MAGLQKFADTLGDAVRQTIRAFHGSPHDFDRFDSSKIGTGEGVQAFGHGLYFAQSEELAERYRKALAGPPTLPDVSFDGTPGYELWGTEGYPERNGIAMLQALTAHYPEAKRLERILQIKDDLPRNIEQARLEKQRLLDSSGGVISDESLRLDNLIDELDGAQRLFDRFSDVLPVPGNSRPGKTYEVEIDAPEQAMLDWDSTMSRQPLVAEAARNIAQSAPDRQGAERLLGYLDMDVDGGLIYHGIGDAFRPASSPKIGWQRYMAQKASGALRDAGVPGVKYWDGFSRGGQEGTRNYVMFPGTEDKIRILRKYGLLAPVAASQAFSED